MLLHEFLADISIICVLARLTRTCSTWSGRKNLSMHATASLAFVYQHERSDSSRWSHQVSRVKPTFTVTCQSATLLFSRWPRTSATSNHFIFRIVLPARVIALFTASST